MPLINKSVGPQSKSFEKNPSKANDKQKIVTNLTTPGLDLKRLASMQLQQCIKSAIDNKSTGQTCFIDLSNYKINHILLKKIRSSRFQG